MKIWVDRSKELVGENIHLIPTILVQHQVENKDILLGNGCINSPSLRFCQDIGLSILRSPYFAQTSLQTGYCTSGSSLAGHRVCNDRENTDIILFIFIVVFSFEIFMIHILQGTGAFVGIPIVQGSQTKLSCGMIVIQGCLCIQNRRFHTDDADAFNSYFRRFNAFLRFHFTKFLKQSILPFSHGL